MPAQPSPLQHDRPAPLRQARWLTIWLAAILCSLLCLAGAARAQTAPQPQAMPLTVQGIHNLGDGGQLFYADDVLAEGETGTPPTTAALPSWLASLRPAKDINLFGGAYWLYAQVRNDSGEQQWVIDPNDTLIDQVAIHVYEPDEPGAPLTLLSGYQQEHDYLLHYGKNVLLEPGVTYRVLIRFSSPYYARAPLFAVTPQQAYRKLVGRENFLMVGSLAPCWRWACSISSSFPSPGKKPRSITRSTC